MKKTLIICGVGSGMTNSLKDIIELNVSLVVITDLIDANVKKYADKIIKCYPRDRNIVNNAIDKSHIKKIDGVMTLGYENMPVIASIAERFNINGPSVETTLNYTLKNLRTPLLSKNGIPTPKFIISKGFNEAMKAIKHVGFPCVVKPNDKTSSIGVAKISNDNNLEYLVKNALKHSQSDIIIIEEFLLGTEHTVEGLIFEGNIYITAISDRNYSEKERYLPFFFENGDTLPSILNENVIKKMINIVKDGIKILGINNSGFHCDILVTYSGEIIVLEITGRIAGSRFGTEIVPLHNGINITKNIARLALGMPIELNELKAKYNKPVVLRYLTSNNGKVTEIGKLNKIKKMQGIFDVIWEQNLSIGTQVGFLSGKDVIASVIAKGISIKDAENNALMAIKLIPIKIEI